MLLMLLKHHVHCPLLLDLPMYSTGCYSNGVSWYHVADGLMAENPWQCVYGQSQVGTENPWQCVYGQSQVGTEFIVPIITRFLIYKNVNDFIIIS